MRMPPYGRKSLEKSGQKDPDFKASLHIITLLATNIWIFYGDRNLKPTLNQIWSILTFLSVFDPSNFAPWSSFFTVSNSSLSIMYYFFLHNRMPCQWPLIFDHNLSSIPSSHHISTNVHSAVLLQNKFVTHCISSWPRVREYLERLNCKLHQVHQAFFGDLRLKTRRAFGFGIMPLVKSIFLGRVVIPGG